jgi:uncharacterized membrane protein YkgB
MNYQYFNQAIKICLIVSLALLGIAYLLDGSPKEMALMVSFYHLERFLTATHFSYLFGVLMLCTAMLLALGQRFRIAQVGMWLLGVIAAIPLFTLLDASRYIQDLGGFPILGSGQGVIKYLAIVPLGLSLFYSARFSQAQLAWLNYIPVAMVLFWIGGLKFYEFEAKGIVSLVSTSPFMSWLYELFSVQWASNLIGTYDILMAALLAVAIKANSKSLLLVAAMGCGAVFVMTQSFLFTASGSFSSQTVLAGLGQFVIKDLWFIGNLLVILHCAYFRDSCETKRQ